MLLNTWELVNTWEIPEVVSDEQPSGGYEFWIKFEQEQLRKDEERRQQIAARRKAKKITAKLDRELALEQRKIEADLARKAELARINRLVANYHDVIIDMGSPVIIRAMEQALEFQTFSKIERLERELTRMHEEELFMLICTQILVNQ